MIVNKFPLFFFFVLAICILWQLLLPGYILTLDMVFVPDVHAITASTGYLNSLPLDVLISGLGAVFPGWILQKGMLLILFFCLGYLPFRYLPLAQDELVRLFSAFVYMLNPFVYTRLLAGQWTLLFAYALLPLFFHHLILLVRSPNKQQSFSLFGSLFVISLFSLHLFTMCCLIGAAWYLFHVVRLRTELGAVKRLTKMLVWGLSVFLVISSYWFVPLILESKPHFEQRFDQRHWEAFAPVGSAGQSPLISLIALVGFWGEAHPWSEQFQWPQDHVLFWSAMGMIWILSLIGFLRSRDSLYRNSFLFFFVGVGVASVVFACGIADTPFRGVNQWMFEHVGIWRGFRDSQKFCALLAYVSALFSGIGLSETLRFLEQKQLLKAPLRVICLIIPLFFGVYLWGGFRGQLHSVWYPSSWEWIDDRIVNDSSQSRTLFLPWHGYMSFDFNHHLLVASPFRAYFGERALVSKNIEFGDVYDQEVDEDYKRLDALMRESPEVADGSLVDYLQTRNISKVVYFQDLISVDPYRYSFLSLPEFREVYRDQTVVIYEVESVQK